MAARSEPWECGGGKIPCRWTSWQERYKDSIVVQAGKRGGRVVRLVGTTMGGDLYALDLYDVFYDSCGETSLSAVKVCAS
jgi:hypothetical protein